MKFVRRRGRTRLTVGWITCMAERTATHSLPIYGVESRVGIKPDPHKFTEVLK